MCMCVGCVGWCISYFYVVMIKHYDQSDLMEERVDFGLYFQRDKSPEGWGGMAAGRNHI